MSPTIDIPNCCAEAVEVAGQISTVCAVVAVMVTVSGFATDLLTLEE